jgi:hypothetical protein
MVFEKRVRETIELKLEIRQTACADAQIINPYIREVPHSILRRFLGDRHPRGIVGRIPAAHITYPPNP